MRRIDDKTYGYCERCFQPIPEAASAGAAVRSSLRGVQERRAVAALTRFGVLAFAIAVIVVVADRVTTHSPRITSTTCGTSGAPSALALTYNSGFAFSLFSGRALFVTVLLCIGVVVLAFVVAQVRTVTLAVGSGLVLGGAIGNLSERIVGGHGGQVPDFITLEHWPTFNVADACVTVGSHHHHRGPSLRWTVPRCVRGRGGRVNEDAGDGAARCGSGCDRPGSGETISTEVPALLAGVRVDRGVAMVADVSRATAAELIAAGRVLVDGAPVGVGRIVLREGATLTVVLPAPGDGGVAPEPGVRFEVVYADEEVAVVDKPAGLVVHPGAGHVEGTLVGGLLARFPDLAELVSAGVCPPDRPGIVHRLDKGTSGLLAVARTEEAYRALVDQLATRTMERRYLALVAGRGGRRAG